MKSDATWSRPAADSDGDAADDRRSPPREGGFRRGDGRLPVAQPRAELADGPQTALRADAGLALERLRALVQAELGEELLREEEDRALAVLEASRALLASLVGWTDGWWM